MTDIDLRSRVVVRAALAARIAAAQPVIISIVAPAGFGKTTFVRQLVHGEQAVAICDCRGVGSPIEFARRIISALADEMPDRAPNLSQSATIVGDGGNAEHDAIALLLSAWRVRTRKAIFVFENAEDIVIENDVRDLLARLLTSRPPERTIVVSSREPLRIHLTRFAAPHEVISVRAEDLAFTVAEVAEILTLAGSSAEHAEKIATVSGGWPIAVLLLARFASEGRLEELLLRLDDVAYEELHEYLADEVMAAMPSTLIDALAACAAIPNATPRDLTLALVDRATVDAFVAFERTSPFVTRDKANVFEVHVLIVAILNERYPDRSAALLQTASNAYESAGEYLRAAQISLARDDQLEAARLLAKLEVIEDRAPDLAYANILAALDREVIMRYPRLWAVTALLQTFSADSNVLLAEAERLWSGLAPDVEPIERVYIFVFRVLLRSYVGRFSEALAIVDEFRASIAAPDPPTTQLHARLLYLRSLMTARMGNLAEARRDVELALPLVQSMYVMAGGSLLVLATDIERVLGNRAAERTLIERALVNIRSTSMSNFIAFYLAEATFGAWLAGDEDEYAEYAFLLGNEVAREGIAGFAFFAARARQQDVIPRTVDLLKWVIAGHLIAALDASEPDLARDHARAAHAAALRFHSPFMETLAHLALAATATRAERADHFACAIKSAASIDSEPLHAAVAGAASGGDAGFLQSFMRRLDRAEPLESHGLAIEFTTGTIRRNGVTLSIPEREMALLFALALRPEPIPRERLTDMLWVDLDDDAARNAFHVCSHRLKARLESDAAIVHTRSGYAVRTDIEVDLWQIDRSMLRVRTASVNGPARKTLLQSLYRQLCGVRSERFDDWEWFAPVARHLRELRAEVAQLLATDALNNGETDEALALAKEMIRYDACDEPAREIAIKAHLATGNKAAALQHFRQYRDVLKAELQCEPSATIAALIEN